MPYPVKKLIYVIWCRTTKAGKVANKGERFVASSWKEIVESGEFYHLYHAHRYWWAEKQIPKGSHVWDYGCGSGYGSWYLASIGDCVLGMDISKEAIGWAKKHFTHKFLRFENRCSPHEMFDAITCFEVIEHIEEQETFLKTLSKCLMTGSGVLLISTANGSKDSVRQCLIDKKLVTVNPMHIKELKPIEFGQLLQKHFRYVELFGQCIKGVYSFGDWTKWQRKNNVKLKDFEMRSDDFLNCEVVVAKCQN
jgi:ubiquinone/menaquinone biosynthesis C-methylase UbiE